MNNKELTKMRNMFKNLQRRNSLHISKLRSDIPVIDGELFEKSFSTENGQTIMDLIPSVTQKSYHVKTYPMKPNLLYIEETSHFMRLVLLFGSFASLSYSESILAIKQLLELQLVSESDLEIFVQKLIFPICIAELNEHDKHNELEILPLNKMKNIDDVTIDKGININGIIIPVLQKKFECVNIIIQDEDYAKMIKFMQNNFCRSFAPILLGLYGELNSIDLGKFSILNLFELTQRRKYISLVRCGGYDSNRWEPIYSENMLQCIQCLKVIYSEELKALQQFKIIGNLFVYNSGIISARIQALYSFLFGSTPPQGFSFSSFKTINIPPSTHTIVHDFEPLSNTIDDSSKYLNNFNSNVKRLSKKIKRFNHTNMDTY